ncbi:MAG TPA: glycosyltransferase family 9 protein [Gemmatimonadaceae bacterium]|nr:glycosyltransferase family 9 protein [Gemmatimonadaceae bacterium]
MPRHIRIVLLSGLGDAVHGLPLVNAIKDADPDVHITWVVEPMPSAILEGHDSIDRVVIYRRREGVRGVWQLRRDLGTAPTPDLTLNLNVYFKSIWPTIIHRSRRRLGFGRDRSFERVHLASNEHLPSRPWAHTADMFLEFADYLDVAPKQPEWRIRFTEQELRAQSEFFERFGGRPVATIVPASASIKKDWASDRWAEVASSLESDFGFRVVIAGGPGDREREIAREIVELSSAKIEWAMGDSVRRLAWIVGGSNLLVAPDTGPVHIARALGVPVVGIYGHTNPWRVGPWHAYSDLWVDHYTPVGSQPDPTNRTPKWDVMPTIQASEVIQKIAVAVERYGVIREKAQQL